MLNDKVLTPVSCVFDFPLSVHFSHTSPLFSGWGVADEHREIRLRTSAGLLAQARVQPLSAKVSRRLHSPLLLLLRSLSLPGFRPTYFSRQPARQRNLPPRTPTQTLPCWLPRPHLPQHLGRCQRQ